MGETVYKVTTQTPQGSFFCYYINVETQGRGEQQSDVLWYTLWKTALYVWRPLVLTVLLRYKNMSFEVVNLRHDVRVIDFP